LRSDRRKLVLQLALLPAAVLAGVLTLLPTTEGPTKALTLIHEAISGGRLLRPPVPFDPGWRPPLVVLMVLIGFGSAWVAAVLQRPQLALLMPLTVLLLTAISQPAEGEFIAGLVAFIPFALALALLFGGDAAKVSSLTSAFEMKRALRAVPFLVLSVSMLFAVSRTDVLFPKPVYNPAEKPQKPKPIRLGEVRDEVLFEVDGELNGPWKMGVLDFYDGTNWRLPPFDTKRFKKLPSNGVVDRHRASDKVITFTVVNLHNNAVLPGLPAPTELHVKAGGGAGDVVFDPRTQVFRQRQGRVPVGLTYTMAAPNFPTPDQLANTAQVTGIDRDLTYIPKPTPAVRRLLEQAPENKWQRLEFLRKKLNDVVIAAGSGAPNKAVPPSKVDDLLEGSHEGTPFEIVAAEAMLTRWAGIPSRIGYGFDGVLEENGKKVIRPKLGANWLEAYFQGYGWVPLIGAPPKAKTTLDADPNAKFDPNIVPSDDVAVELYVPVKVDDLGQLYERVRSIMLRASPFFAAALALYLSLPSLYRAMRRRRRRRWALGEGLRAQIAVEYCEFRDTATDLNVGDPDDTPLEYLAKVADDAEHAELAWLVTRATYGDLMDGGLTESDVEAARAMATSLRNRMLKVQLFQSRVLAALSRASLRDPYSDEVPNVRMLGTLPRRPRLPKLPRVLVLRRTP
jgi:hypothetical protein